MDRNHRTNDETLKPRLALTASEAAKAIGIGTRLLWTMTNRGDVPHARIGRRVVYPIAALEEWLAARAKGGAQL